jgi:hypothetical protein
VPAIHCSLLSVTLPTKTDTPLSAVEHRCGTVKSLDAPASRSAFRRPRSNGYRRELCQRQLLPLVSCCTASLSARFFINVPGGRPINLRGLPDRSVVSLPSAPFSSCNRRGDNRFCVTVVRHQEPRDNSSHADIAKVVCKHEMRYRETIFPVQAPSLSTA